MEAKRGQSEMKFLAGWGPGGKGGGGVLHSGNKTGTEF